MTIRFFYYMLVYLPARCVLISVTDCFFLFFNFTQSVKLIIAIIR